VEIHLGMKRAAYIVVLMVSSGCTPTMQATGDQAGANAGSTEPAIASGEDSANNASIVPPPLDQKRLERLLNRRVDGGMTPSNFSQFANHLLATSDADVGVRLNLSASTKAIAETELQSPFPRFYRPTVRELLDAISLQTFSEWTYDPTEESINRVKSAIYSAYKNALKEEVDEYAIAIFEFVPKQRAKPFEIALAPGWKASDKGNWVMYVPPVFQVGMDVYEMGTYSTDRNKPPKDLFQKVMTEVSLKMVRRARPEVREEDLKPAKVGSYDALFFETIVPGANGSEVHWRQWAFMVDDRCYFILNIAVPQFKDVVFPAVDSMLASFRAKPQVDRTEPK
jgi:hypothetical protein